MYNKSDKESIDWDWPVICDLCGRQMKRSQVRKNYQGFMVCLEDWENKHPSELPVPSFSSEGKPIKDARPPPPVVYTDIIAASDNFVQAKIWGDADDNAIWGGIGDLLEWGEDV